MERLEAPTTIHDGVYRLRSKLGLSTKPVFVPVADTTGFARDNCFPNTTKKVASDGGTIQHGWTVWELPGKLIEGEFHAVWVSPEGALIDITPKRDGETQILFIPDPKRIYEDRMVGTVRLPLDNDPRIRRMIEFNEAMFRLRTRKNQNGLGFVDPREITSLMHRTSGRNDKCYCGSDKKFKHCHGAQ